MSRSAKIPAKITFVNQFLRSHAGANLLSPQAKHPQPTKCAITRLSSATTQKFAQIDPGSIGQSRCDRPENVLFGRLRLLGFNFDTMLTDSGFPLLALQYQERIYFRTGKHQSLDPQVTAHYSIPENATVFATSQKGSMQTNKLPSEAVFDSLLCELSSKFSHYYPIIDIVRSKRAAEIAYRPGQRSCLTTQNAQAKAHVFAVLALGRHLLPDSFMTTYVGSCFYARESHRLVGENLHTVDLLTLQTVIMLVSCTNIHLGVTF